MAGRYLLEISVAGVEAAVAAERGGADRIELCAELAVGGLTPSEGLMRAARQGVTIPIFAMIRPRGGGFVYSAQEFEAMRASIVLAKKLGMDGVVLGMLAADGLVDVARTRELMELAKPLPVTFHRAFDECVDQVASLEDVIQAGAARVLTSGGAATAEAGAATIKRLIAAGGERIVILPGAGIHPGNAAEIVQATGAKEIHSGLSSALGRSASPKMFGEEVTKLTQVLRAADRSK